MKSIFVLVLVLVVLFLSLSCSESYDYSQASLGLGLRDYSCTEAWIEVQIGSNDKTANIYIKKNDEIIQTVKVGESETLFYFDDLLPNTAYKFDAVTYEDGKEVKSNPVTFTTLDTTSHNFTWQTFTFGQHSSSELYDVAIIDENSIWAVGEIYITDSLGNTDQTPYNVAKWDGQYWKIERVYYNYQGSNVITPLRSIHSFSENDIWVGSNQPMHWNGSEWQKWDLLGNIWNGWINQIWGTSSNDLYIVGNSGSIAHYNGRKWTKIESGTSDNLLDLRSTSDGNTVWTCGYSGDYANSVLIRIKDGVAEKIYEGSSNGQSNGFYVGPMSGVWTDNDYRVFLMTGSGLYTQKNSNEFFLEKTIARFNHGSYGIGGIKSNDIFVCGDRFVGHWNGSTYSEYSELYRQFRTYYNISTKGNIVCAVGTDYSDALNFGAIIAIGRRN